MRDRLGERDVVEAELPRAAREDAQHAERLAVDVQRDDQRAGQSEPGEKRVAEAVIGPGVGRDGEIAGPQRVGRHGIDFGQRTHVRLRLDGIARLIAAGDAQRDRVADDFADAAHFGVEHFADQGHGVLHQDRQARLGVGTPAERDQGLLLDRPGIAGAGVAFQLAKGDAEIGLAQR